MVSRKKQSKAIVNPPAQQDVRQPSRSSPTRNVQAKQFRPLESGDGWKNLMGDETDSSENNENDSSRGNTSHSRPNFSFLPLDKHSSPMHPKTPAHRIASMSTVPNSDLARPSSSSSMSTQSSFNDDQTPIASSSRLPPPSNQKLSRKQQTPHKLKALKEIIKYQGTVENLIPKLSFSRVIREILAEYSHQHLRVTVEMLICLQEAAEVYVVQLLEDSYRCTTHRGRVTLIPKDMQLALRLRRD
ncbi:uncharacterized protein LOC128723862 [Anopheles nili]|uniref:uncharacterized protein LOC128723862 n=1 Tax=Anopheles nili TaxID=185578 RepID=UPI00237B77DF|nr:uncharacterized protein LOC128723862 [Anopheles nili]